MTCALTHLNEIQFQMMSVDYPMPRPNKEKLLGLAIYKTKFGKNGMRMIKLKKWRRRKLRRKGLSRRRRMLRKEMPSSQN